MFSVEALRELYAHMEWADAKVWSVALKPGRASTDESLRDKLLHIHRTQRGYLNMWTDRPQETGPSNVTDLAEIYRWAHPYYAEVQAFLATADSSTLALPVSEPFRQRMEQGAGAARSDLTIGDTVCDVPSHTAHHRGQLNVRLRELDGVPPMVDYVVWVWSGRPAAEWEHPH